MINRVILLGYVGDEPEVRSFEGGTKMARLRVATNERLYVAKSQQWRNHTEWHTVIVWGEIATYVSQDIHKGTQVYIEGALRSREEVTKEGLKSRITEIAGRDIKIVNQPPKEEPPKDGGIAKEERPSIIPPKEDIDKIPF